MFRSLTAIGLALTMAACAQAPANTHAQHMEKMHQMHHGGGAMAAQDMEKMHQMHHGGGAMTAQDMEKMHQMHHGGGAMTAQDMEKMHQMHHGQAQAKAAAPQAQPRGTAPFEALRAALVRAQEALKEGRIDAAAYERIMMNHQRTVATLTAIQALGWGNYPPPPANAAQIQPRPPTRIEAIERLTERLYGPEYPAKPPTGPRK